MNKSILTILLVLMSTQIVACSKDDKKSAREKLHDCMWNENIQCKKMMADFMADPRNRPMIEAEMANNPQLAAKLGWGGELTDSDWASIEARARANQAKLDQYNAGAPSVVAAASDIAPVNGIPGPTGTSVTSGSSTLPTPVLPASVADGGADPSAAK